MNLDLHGKTALVCGSTAGIGRATAIELASLGAACILLARDETKLERTCAELPRPKGAEHRWLSADFADPSAVNDAAMRALELAPTGAVHILVNNTGGPAGGPIIDARADAFLDAFRMHLVNNHALVQKLAPGMSAAGYGRVINIISTSVKAPIPGLGVSNTIRGAVASWAKTLATELAPQGITVNNILPGFTDTERLTSLFTARATREGKTFEAVLAGAVASIPAGRLGLAEEVAAAAAFLATPAAAYINGINLPVDGGRTPSL